MRNSTVWTAGLLAASIGVVSAATAAELRGPAQGYYYGSGALTGIFPDNLGGAPASRTPAFAPDRQPSESPAIPMWREREHRYDSSQMPSQGNSVINPSVDLYKSDR